MPEVQAVFRSAMAEMVAATQADRAVILFSDDPAEPSPKVRSVHNLPDEGFWTVAPVCTELLTLVRKTGEPLGLSNVPDDPRWGGSFSMSVASIRSLVCVPIWGGDDHPDGLLYVDWLGNSDIGVSRCQEILQGVARRIEGFVTAILKGQGRVDNPFKPVATRVPPAERAPAQPRATAASADPYVSRSRRSFKAPRLASQALFFRSLAVLFQSGLPLQRGLFILAKQSQDSESREICLELGRRLERGQNFSDALESLEVFRPTISALVRVAEQSGSLHAVLEQISKMEERRGDQLRRLQVGLVYPLSVAVLALIFLIAVPSLMLSHLSDLLRELTPSLSWGTRAVLAAAHWITMPLSWLGIALLIALVIRQRSRLSLQVLRWSRRLPLLKPVFESMDLCQFTQALALQVQVGALLQLALRSSSQVVASESPLGRAAQEMEDQLKSGLDLHQIFAGTGLFPPLVVGMVRVGEETGRLDYVLHRLVQFYEDDFHQRLETLSSLLEPLVICGLGIGVGLMLLLTLLPMVRALEAL